MISDLRGIAGANFPRIPEQRLAGPKGRFGLCNPNLIGGLCNATIRGSLRAGLHNGPVRAFESPAQARSRTIDAERVALIFAAQVDNLDVDVGSAC